MTGVCVIVPMRANSKRVINKNIRDFHGKPLFMVMLDKLMNVDEITTICVDTNDERIKKVIEEKYSNIMLIDRPNALSSEFESVNNIIAHDLQFINEEIVMQTHVTNPILETDTISKAIKKLKKGLEKGFDSLFSVTRVFNRYWDSKGNAVNHDPTKLIRTQDLPPFYEENSCIYLFTKDGFKEAGNNRLGVKRILYEIDDEEAIDIDEEIDFDYALFIAEKRRNRG